MIVRLEFVEKNFEDLSLLDTKTAFVRFASHWPENRSGIRRQPKAISSELGGKSPYMVFADADMELAIQGAAMVVLATSGQICSAGTRVFVERDIYESFVGEVAAYTRKLTVDKRS